MQSTKSRNFLGFGCKSNDRKAATKKRTGNNNNRRFVLWQRLHCDFDYMCGLAFTGELLNYNTMIIVRRRQPGTK